MQIHRTHLKLLKRSTTGQLHGLLPTQRQSVTDVFRPNTNFIWFSETTEPQIQILLRICKSLRAHSHPGQQPKRGGGVWKIHTITDQGGEGTNAFKKLGEGDEAKSDNHKRGGREWGDGIHQQFNHINNPILIFFFIPSQMKRRVWPNSNKC